METDSDQHGSMDSTLRIYEERIEINKVCLMEGELPRKEGEIAIDRIYADNNKIQIGNTITAGEAAYTVTGLVALSDYSALFSSNEDMMFDAVKFGVAVVSREAFGNINETVMQYEYAWKYDHAPKNEQEEKELPDISFFRRFRLRIIFQNSSSYLTLFTGIVFANILLLFGMMMTPLLAHYQDEVLEHMPADYQYILKVPAEISDPSAEKYCVTSLKTADDGDGGEEISIYGITDDSRYLTLDMPDEGVCISDGYAEKYRLKEGEKAVLHDPWSGKEYEFEISGIINYPSALAIFMSNRKFCTVFEKEEVYFDGYFSDSPLTEIDDSYVAACITEDDLTKLSRRLNVSMGKMFYLVNVFAVVLFALLIYLLTKLVLEKNTVSISMVKILGYEDGEIARLYLLATTWVVILSILASLFLSTWIIELIYREIMKGFSGWLKCYIEPEIYGEMFVMGMIAYLLVALLQLRKIRKIPMDEALKNIE